MEKENNSNEIIKLAEKIYEGLSEQDIDEIEKIMLDRSNFFGKNPNRILELLEGITEDNLHGEIDWGKPVGKEIID
ncbi:MAG: hypothetical protein M3Q33_14230 [Acidobacteriota bacterium]|nr:hypothetical protein [Acidobacteriota bacterium]